MKVTLEEWIPVGYWVWDVKDEDDICGICQNAFDGVCGTCDEPGDQCPLLFGTCSHIFHMHCILRWTEKMQPDPLCPLCKRKWQVITKEDEREAANTSSSQAVLADITAEIVSQDMQENVPTMAIPLTTTGDQPMQRQQSQTQQPQNGSVDNSANAAAAAARAAIASQSGIDWDTTVDDM